MMFAILSLFLGIPAGVSAAQAWVDGRRLQRRVRRELRARPQLQLGAGSGAGSDEGVVVRVTGVVLAGGETLVAPLSGRACVAYRSVARVRSQVGAGSPATQAAQQVSARPLGLPPESVAMVPFVLDGGAAGRVAIEGEHVVLALPTRRLSARALGPDRPDRFLALHAVAVSSRAKCTFEETLLEPGARITVAGLLMKDVPVDPDAGERGFRDAGAPSVRLAGNAEHPVLIGEPMA